MKRNPWLILIKGGLSMSLTLMAILFALSLYFYQGNRNMLINFFGSVFFAGIYMLFGTSILHVFFRRSGPYEGSIAINRLYQGFYVSRELTVGANEEKTVYGKYVKGVADPALILYGYFTGVLCFFIGMFGVASLIG